MKWIKFDLEHRRNHITDLLTQARLPLLAKEYLLNVVQNEELIQSSSQCCNLWRNAIQCHEPPIDSSYLYNLRRHCQKDNVGLMYVMCPTKIKWFDMLACQWYSYSMPKRDCIPVTLKDKICKIGSVSCELVIYDPLNHSESILTTKRHIHQQLMDRIRDACALDNFIYICEGYHAYNKHIIRYNILIANQWDQILGMSVARCSPGLEALNGFVYAIGGIDANGIPIQSVSCHDVL